MLKAINFFWLCVSWVSFASGVLVVVVIVTTGGVVVVVSGVVVIVAGLDLSIVVFQCMKLPILNASKESCCVSMYEAANFECF